MKLQFVLGRAKSGKSYGMYNRIIAESEKHPEYNYIFVVPEQAGLSAQQELVRIHPRHSLFGVDVMGFKRLAYRIFEEENVLVPVVLDEVGKSMLLRKTLIKVEDDLMIFKGGASRGGFIEKLKSVLSEFSQYQMDADTLKRGGEGLFNKPQLYAKLHDLLVILGEWNKTLADTYITAENLMPELIKCVPRSALLKNSVIILDGFSDFTPVQLKLIQELIARCREVYVILDMSEGQYRTMSDENALFHLSKKTINALTKLSGDLGLSVQSPMWFSEKTDYYESAEIRFLERHYEQTRGVYLKPTEDVVFMEAKNPTDEVEMVCAQLLKLVRERGWRYKDFAIVTTDMHTYGHILERKLLQAGIPYFGDNRHSLKGNIGVEAAIGAMEAVLDNFSYEAVFRYLKCGFFDDLYTIDLMENYCLAAGIRGLKKYQQKWEWKPRTITEKELERINEKKTALCKPLFNLNKSIKGRLSVSERLRALRDWMESVGFSDRMKQLSETLMDRGEAQLSQEYEQVHEHIKTLMTQMDEMIGQEHISLKELVDIFKTGLDESSAGIVPPTLDCLIIGDLRRSRLPNVKAVFVIGMNEGSFPSVIGAGGLLNDADREELEAEKINLAPTAKKESFTDKFYVYRAITKPSHKLFLSYSRQGEDGNKLHASYILGQIQRIFPNAAKISENEELYHVRQGLEILAAGKNKNFKGLYRFYENQPGYAGELKLIDEARAVGRRAEKIDDSTAKQLFSQPPITSVTHLEKFAACQMAHFLKYGLFLNERQEYRLAHTDMGNLYHDAFDWIFRVIKRDGLSIKALSEEDKLRLTAEGIRHAMEGFTSDLFDASFKNDHIRKRMGDVIRFNLDAVIAQLKAGEYSPAATEMAFGMKGMSQYPPIKIEDSPMLLMGKIDRLDEAMGEDGSRYVRIVDYKTGNISLDFTKLVNGLQLQLMLYLYAALSKGSALKPAGAFYYHITEPVPEIEREELNDLTQKEIEALVRTRQMEMMRLNGILNGDEESIRLFESDLSSYKKSRVLDGLRLKNDGGIYSSAPVTSEKNLWRLMDEAKKQTVRLEGEMLNGKVEANPYLYKGKKPCDYCEYRQICGFNTSFFGYQYRRIGEQNMKEFFENQPEE